MRSRNGEEPTQEKRMGRDYFFPTPIYYTDLPAHRELNDSLCKQIYAWRDQDPEGTVRSNVAQAGAWHSATDMHARQEYKKLTLEIFEMMQGIYDDLGYDPAFEPVCDSMWANINPRYAYNRHHTHPHALWSGVYYVKTPQNCGLLSFTDPRSQTQVLTPYYDVAKRRANTWNEVYYEPLEGRLIAFPAWLVHAVQPNLSNEAGADGDRISISFNFYQRRRGMKSPNPHRKEIVRDDLMA